MEKPIGLVLTKGNMQEIEYILNSMLEQQCLIGNTTCYISVSTKSYISKFKCDKLRIFKFNDLYRITFNQSDYENIYNHNDYECFSIDEKLGGLFKFDISFSEAYRSSVNRSTFVIHLNQFFI